MREKRGKGMGTRLYCVVGSGHGNETDLINGCGLSCSIQSI